MKEPHGTTMLRPVSVLELLHPDGVAEVSVVFGSGCPSRLLPPWHTRLRSSADLVVVAPSRSECRAGEWLKETLGAAARMLTPAGLVFVLPPPGWRKRIQRELQREGLTMAAPVLYLDGDPERAYLVPLDGRSLHAFLRSVRPRVSWRDRAAAQISRLPFTEKLLAALHPRSGLIMRHGNSRRLFEWTHSLGSFMAEPGGTILRTRWQNDSGMALLYGFSDAGELPVSIIKVPLTGSAAPGCYREVDQLRRLGSAAQAAGTRIPSSTLLHAANGRPVQLQTVVRGESAAQLLASGKVSFPEVIEPLAQWLERWSQATATQVALDREWLERQVLDSARRLAPLLPQGERYLAWLTARCDALTGEIMPLVSTHNDLTMFNLLLDDSHAPGVVDWEAAEERGFPLTDFFYAATDAAAAAGSYRDRLQALQACFGSEGLYASRIGQLTERLRRAIDVSADFGELCFHACWLHHAGNEHARSRAGQGRPFLEILRWLAGRDCTAVALGRNLRQPQEAVGRVGDSSGASSARHRVLSRD